ncbi:LytR/AlgR family response regulator transcription factor [Flagellimonas pacifica]|uniref:Two component transcriptional regulator, LytTR family n=1 Tax=Flagellimonas pacifica TaxID=1247520 RepID=A0A285MZH5_9FLAO|nr:response regulator transcription factor [Allomuricauda parva]SNZ01937.1 two component transcriptional regulator, LytTR family [Allomuricauda parva]
MRCIIIEDQPPAQRILKKFIEDVNTLELKGVFSDALLALEFLKSEEVELLFLDIHLPKISGIDFLKTLSNPPQVILTTAFSEYALESYELNVVDYLLKPFSFQRFLKAIAKVPLNPKVEGTVDTGQLQEGQRGYVYIKSGHELFKVDLDAIEHIDSDSDYTEVVTAKKKYLSNEPLRYWLESLPNQKFKRIHKSHIINSDKIEKLIGNQVNLSGGDKIPIGRAYKEAFLKEILK